VGCRVRGAGEVGKSIVRGKWLQGQLAGQRVKCRVRGDGRRQSVPVTTLLYSDLGPVGAKRRSAEEVGSGEGRRSPSSLGVWGFTPRKIFKFNMQIYAFSCYFCIKQYAESDDVLHLR